MPPSQVYIRLQHGIIGGFIPPRPSAIHQLSLSTDSSEHVVVNSAFRPNDQSSLVSSVPKKIVIDSHMGSLIEELHSILKSLPMERPPESEDIYGLNTSIIWSSNDLKWQNGAPSGCIHGTSKVKASGKEKRKFKRAVDIVNELVKKSV